MFGIVVPPVCFPVGGVAPPWFIIVYLWLIFCGLHAGFYYLLRWMNAMVYLLQEM
ncbi:hypothetical protein [Dickeya chrysanthemi]|uniref:hypothetical protein n=1 Tax=Dickeya chrysanthemi TaxID=556 RepID=UPI003015D2CA